jgi:hypothetical protein
VWCDELLLQPVASDQCGVFSTGEDQPVVSLRRNSRGTRPSVPNRPIRACSRALAEVLALPDRDRCLSRSSRVWQSMTKASVGHQRAACHGSWERRAAAAPSARRSARKDCSSSPPSVRKLESRRPDGLKQNNGS